MDWALDRGRIVVSDHSMLKFFTTDGTRTETLFTHRSKPDEPLRAFAISRNGHVAPSAANDVVYTAITLDGEYLTLSAQEFQKRFAWKNDKSQVRYGLSASPDKW